MIESKLIKVILRDKFWVFWENTTIYGGEGVGVAGIWTPMIFKMITDKSRIFRMKIVLPVTFHGNNQVLIRNCGYYSSITLDNMFAILVLVELQHFS